MRILLLILLMLLPSQIAWAQTPSSGTFDASLITLAKSCTPPVDGQYQGASGKLWNCQIVVDVTAATSSSTGSPNFNGYLTINDVVTPMAGTGSQIVSMTSQSGNFNCSSGQACIIVGQLFATSGIETIDVQVFLSENGQNETFGATNCSSGTYFAGLGQLTAISGSCVSTSWTGSSDGVDPISGNDSIETPSSGFTSNPDINNSTTEPHADNLGLATAIDATNDQTGPNTGDNTNDGGTGTETSLDTAKSCDPIVSLGNGSYSLTCQLTVTGSNLPAGETIVLADLFAGQTGNSMGLLPFLTNFSSNEPWSCGALNTNIQGCTLDPADLAAAGGTSTLSTTTVFQNPDKQAQAFNCLQIDTKKGFPAPGGKSARQPLPSGIKGFSKGQNKSAHSQFGDVCVVVDIPKPGDKPTVTGKVQKRCQQMPRIGSTINLICEINVSLSGPVSGTVTVSDLFTQLSGSPVSYVAQVGSNEPAWTCNSPAFSAQNPMACSISGADLASLGNSSGVWALFSIPARDYKEATFKNCGTISMGDTQLADPDCIPLGNGNGDTGDNDNNNDGGLVSQNPGSAANPNPSVMADDGTPLWPDVVDGLVVGSPVPDFPRPTTANLQVSKKSLGACSINRSAQTYECRFQLTVKNIGSGPYNGPVSLLDQFGQPHPTGFSLATTNGWSCSSNNNAIASCLNPSLNLTPGQVSQFVMVVTVPGVRKGGISNNCAKLAVPPSKTQRIAMIQQIMNDRGLNAGVVDGKDGPNTRRALSQLKAELGLPDTQSIDEGLFRALGLGGESKQACVKFKLPPMPRPIPNCDRTTAVQKGDACFCRYSNMTQISPSKCKCRFGLELVKGKGCFKPHITPKPVPNVPRCNPRTTRARGDRCGCLYKGMVQVSPTNCVCKRGTKLVRGKGCVRPVIKPRPLPDGPKCDPRTTRARGNRCVCIIKGAVKVSATKCGCRSNAQMIGGRCVPYRTRPTPDQPKPGKPRPGTPRPGKASPSISLEMAPSIKFEPGKAILQFKN
ncbi:hypothetical protein SAMN04515647_0034 [Cohaesibacter sp. ES.047]|nr:hypothetical protein SAMN04515647_0034 [Cohaesibacter sp. ES.047]